MRIKEHFSVGGEEKAARGKRDISWNAKHTHGLLSHDVLYIGWFW